MEARKFHSWMLTLALTSVAYVVINKFIIEISIIQFIIIEIFMAFMEIFSNFVKVKSGLEKDSESSK